MSHQHFAIEIANKMKHELKECANILEPTTDHDSAVSQAEVLGSEIGDLARRLFSLFAYPAAQTRPAALNGAGSRRCLEDKYPSSYRLARNASFPRSLRATHAAVHGSFGL